MVHQRSKQEESLADEKQRKANEAKEKVKKSTIDKLKKYLEKNKNLHKLSKEEMDARKSGDIGEAKDVPSKKIQKEGK